MAKFLLLLRYIAKILLDLQQFGGKGPIPFVSSLSCLGAKVPLDLLDFIIASKNLSFVGRK